MLSLAVFSHIIPEAIIAISALLLTLLGSLLNRYIKPRLYPFFSIITLICACYFLSINDFFEEETAFNMLFVSSQYTSFSKIVVLFATIASIILSLGYNKIDKSFLNFEFYVLILLSALGMMVMISSNDLMSLYLGLELLSLSLYTVVSYNRNSVFSSEAGLKYFVLGALASAILLYGASLIYGFTGTTNFSSIKTIHQQYSLGAPIPVGVIVGIVLLISGMCFKIAAAPFHMWAPDVYQGAPLPVTAFLSTAPKAASIFLLVKLLVLNFDIWHQEWRQIIIAISCLSLAIGSLGALFQSNIKRLLAYSSINHIGFLLIGLVSYNVAGIEASLIYLCIYLSMNLGIFAFIAMLQKSGDERFDLTLFQGLSKSNPIVSICISILLLSMAGIPPFAGFLAKFYIIYGSIKGEMYFLASFAMITAVISAFYYLKIIKLMYFDDMGKNMKRGWFSVENIIIASFAVTFNVILIIFPTSFNNIISYSVTSLFE
ncbi:MAG: NADH-quinone oxidoreductase subunit N [Alphaproteobacteria bacterium]|nr:NADH-quinone oxidoreductase subunit N [Alphaproteobacteria bacterium]